MRRSVLAFFLVALGCGMTLSPAASPQTRSVSTPATAHRALLDQYCVACHNERAKTAGLMLDKMDLERLPEAAETWEKVIRKLRGGMMPPTGRPRPSNDQTDSFISWL